MDISTIIGVIGCFAFILFGIVSGGEIKNFIDIPSVLIVIGGTICTLIASFPFSQLKNVGKHLTKLFKGKEFQPDTTIDTLIEFAQLARQEGLLALETRAEELTQPFLKQGILLVVDEMEIDKVRAFLEAEISAMDARHQEAVSLYDKGSAVAPAFGMVGTLVGLINMLNNMSLDAGASTSIGKDMGVALITTLYGSIMANIIFGPISKKLKIRNEEEILYKEIIVEGVSGIQSGENPKMLRERLTTLLAQKRREKLMNPGATSKKDKKDEESE